MKPGGIFFAGAICLACVGRPGPEITGNDGPVVKDTVSELSPWDTLPDTVLVDISLLDSTIVLDIRYATSNNFTGQVLYPCPTCMIRLGIARRLVRVNQRLAQRGYRLKVFDCYRPRSVQYIMWERVPDARFVANPDKASVHNRGAAIDVTIVDSAGRELDMGSGFDEFSERSRSDWNGLTPAQKENRWLLREAMESEGFRPVKSEWWHFNAHDWENYSVLDVPIECE
ncbi:MAG: M15 family metallopeptidase [candidate division WOR-3 bacterium]